MTFQKIDPDFIEAVPVVIVLLGECLAEVSNTETVESLFNDLLTNHPAAQGLTDERRTVVSGLLLLILDYMTSTGR